ncbi:Alpha/beta knot methyltransferase, partial [Pelagophyceae sp. CCMP2097]
MVPRRRGLAAVALRRSGLLFRRPAWHGPVSARSQTAGRDAVFSEIMLDAAGVALRRAHLDTALSALGFDATQIDSDALRGSHAGRLYRGYVFPATARALATQATPQRAAAVAAQVAYQARGAIAAAAEGLRNHNNETAPAAPPHDLTIILDGLLLGENVGNILRTAETAGCRRVVACGTTPRPLSAAVVKAALGSAAFVRVEHEPSALRAVMQIKASGCAVWACETTEQSRDIYDVEAPSPLALVFGNEHFGVSPAVLAACDAVIQIPVYGVKNSMNVGNAVSVAAFEVVRQWRRRTTR